jgi:hypothetical protein
LASESENSKLPYGRRFPPPKVLVTSTIAGGTWTAAKLALTPILGKIVFQVEKVV